MDIDPLTPERLKPLEDILGVTFRRFDLAAQALTHSSARDPDRPCNERLEFLGDAVIGQVVCEHLFHRFPDREEGDLSLMKSVLVSARMLADVADEIGLGDYLIVGRGLARRKAYPRSILCASFEAVVAAVFLDHGFEAARELILKFLAPHVDVVEREEYERNYKSLLQDHGQRVHAEVPQYVVINESGPDHRKMFEIEVHIGGQMFGPAWGASKKEAEQNAAREALIALGLLQSEEE